MSVERARYSPEDVEQQPVEEIENYQIGDLEKPLLIILKKLREKIINGDFSTIIGDDASGRIPALILGKVLNGYNSEHGLGKVEILFLAGSGRWTKLYSEKNNRAEEITEYLRTKNVDKNVLVVTDTISTGNSLSPLALALGEMGIKYDIVSAGNAVIDKRNVEKLLGVKPIYGQGGSVSIYSKERLSGVVKDSSDLFSYPLKAGYKKGKAPKRVQRDINQARADADIVAKHLLEKFEELE